MKKLVTGAVMIGLTTATLAAPAGAAGPSRSGSQSAAPQAVVHTADTERYRPRARFARPKTRFGDKDQNAHSIDHVHELQYRLRWVGVYRGPVSGYFGTKTRKAVKRFQRKVHLRRTGIANQPTWRNLIRRTIRRPKRIPQVCKRRGWHACYDRTKHQVTLFRNGRLHNAWLVRGGSSSHPTRRGTQPVYYRDKDHVSSLYGSPMPYSQFFDGGQAFHGSALMTDPFSGHSHGCINMYIKDARQLWMLTSKKRLVATVYGAWD